MILGDGGKGGNGQTDKNCFPAVAVAGNGGQPANFKLTAANSVEILGKFNFCPGKGVVEAGKFEKYQNPFFQFTKMRLWLWPLNTW